MYRSGSAPQPASAMPPEPLLSFDPRTCCWSGANDTFSIWMDHNTFCAYARVWYEWTDWRSDLPHQQRVAAAVAYCRRLTYWHGCEGNYDRRVHITYF